MWGAANCFFIAVATMVLLMLELNRGTSVSKTVVYADYNCPFCFALDELLNAHNLFSKTDWRLIEHAAEVSSQNCAIDDQIELTTEVATVRHRSLQVDISLPPNRPNTGLANRITDYLSQRLDPTELGEVRLRLYRVLWQEGRDISDLETLRDLLADIPFVTNWTDSSDKASAHPALTQWQNEWDNGPYSHRIPVMQGHQAPPLIGLSDIQGIIQYLDQGKAPLKHEVATCQFKARPIVVLIGSMQDHWPLIEYLRDDYDVRIRGNAEQLDAFLRSPEVIDMLFISASLAEPEQLRCLNLIRSTSLKQLSVFKADTAFAEEHQQRSFEQGFDDYFYPQMSPARIRVRCQRTIELKRLTDQLQHQSNRDHLTQLYNRREFEQNLELEWLRASRAKQPLALLMIDIDHFKQFNDSYGHLQGDDCLRLTSSVIAAAIGRAADRAYRYGGEEFSVLLPETQPSGAARIAEKIQLALAEASSPATASPATPEEITVSIGIAVCRDFDPATFNDKSPQKLLTLADEQLMQAKQSGRNAIRVADLV